MSDSDLRVMYHMFVCYTHIFPRIYINPGHSLFKSYLCTVRVSLCPRYRTPLMVMEVLPGGGEAFLISNAVLVMRMPPQPGGGDGGDGGGGGSDGGGSDSGGDGGDAGHEIVV